MTKFAPHKSVLLKESVELLFTDSDGIYMDGTIGFGGHSEEILKKISSNGKLIGIDLDPYALEYSKKRLSKIQASYSLHQGNFREYPNLLQKLGIKELTGILLDLGFSSSQINTRHRGFSFQSNALLDMRFNQEKGITAREYLNTSNVEEISFVIERFGEDRKHSLIAKNIYHAAHKGKMNTTFDLKNAIKDVVNPRFLNKSLARVFQAIRIKINDELGALEETLLNSIQWLKKGGRISTISFHSLEDKLIKKIFVKNSLSCICPRNFPVCKCDTIPTMKLLNRKAIKPTNLEIQKNPRSRSAKLRVAERI